ncbi:hypothetical protein [Bernardetia sp.]|uniref:hypothetical protein n=1 Tax=Bernardetia sp. TaxID=1937974 RepID=UPI0025C5AA1D|nr:hypothetical protein [Bernardetia sp.]
MKKKVSESTSIGARNISRQLKKDFLKVLEEEKIGHQSDFFVWTMQIAIEHQNEFFNFLRGKKIIRSYE